jgi:hypothetical protein
MVTSTKYLALLLLTQVYLQDEQKEKTMYVKRANENKQNPNIFPL